MYDGTNPNENSASKPTSSNPSKCAPKTQVCGSNRFFLALSFILVVFLVWSASGSVFGSHPDRVDAAGFTNAEQIGRRKLNFDLALEVAGFTASRAGTFISTNKAGQHSVSFGTGAISTFSNPGGEGQSGKWTVPSGSDEPRPVHQGSPEQQQYIDYAWDISHDKNFVYLLKAESGALSPTALSKTVGSNGYRDIGLCQINKGYHKAIVNDPRFSDYKWQLDQCYRLYKGGTKFYGKKNIWKVKKYFTWE